VAGVELAMAASLPYNSADELIRHGYPWTSYARLWRFNPGSGLYDIIASGNRSGWNVLP
jgi:hypothetical protein